MFRRRRDSDRAQDAAVDDLQREADVDEAEVGDAEVRDPEVRDPEVRDTEVRDTTLGDATLGAAALGESGSAEEPDDAEISDDDTEAVEDAWGTEEPGPTSGPWDVEDAPADEMPRIDLGGLLVPAGQDIELRVEVTPDGGVQAVTLHRGPSALQLAAYAAPRRSGIWREIRGEIAESLQAAGGNAEEAEGPFGVELHARVPGDVPGQGRVLQPARFLGVDGPRWFLRGLISGPAVVDRAQAEIFEEVFRQTVVVRGKEAMAPRDFIPLRLPRDAQEAVEAAGQKPTADRLERGPEIAETR